MKQLKKTILTLALLIAATTQAWAEDYLYLDISSDGKSATICYGEPDGKPYLDPIGTWRTNVLYYWDNSYNIRRQITTVTFDESCQTFNGKSLEGLFFSFFGLKTLIGLDNLRTDKVENMNGVFAECQALATLDLSSFNTANVTDMHNMFKRCENLTTVDLSSFNTANVENMDYMFNSCKNLTTVDLSSFNTANVEYMENMFSYCSKLETIYVSDDWSTANVQYSNSMFIGCEKLPGYKGSNPVDKQMATLTTAGGYLTYKAPGTPVATPATDATNTALSLTQPTGNVTIRVKYYDQAEFADGLAPAAITGVQASTADPIVTPGTPKTIGTSDVKMGTVKYYAAQSSSNAPTYDSEGWSEAVPTAATFSEGDVYVWYYIAGAEPASVAARSDANTCSDSDIKRLTVNLIAPPTYDVVINTAGLSAEEAGKWSALPNTGVKKGDEVTVTYTGSRKVIGVKAEKKLPDTKYMKWDDSQKTLVATEIPATVTKVGNDNGNVTWSAGTYLVEGDVTIGGRITLSGDVELIIKDGAKLTANRIYGQNNYSLSFYGQSNMSGEVNVANSDYDAICYMTALNIHSCNVNTSSSSEGCGGFHGIKEINLYGGLVDAKHTGDSDGYGMTSITLNIYGGEVKAVGKGNSNAHSYGICGVTGATVTVYGGKLWAECAGNKAIDNSYVTLTKGEGFNGKIETSDNGTSWTEYSGTGTPDAKYVRVGYSSAGAD